MINDFDGTRESFTRIARTQLHEGNAYSALMLVGFIGGCSNPIMRTKCLAEAGGWDEDMPARQDWDTWLRISRKYDISYVAEPLTQYHMYKGEHIADNPVTQRIGLEKIRIKNMDYLRENKYAYWNLLTMIAKEYARSQEYGNSLKTGLKAISLQPLQIKANMITLLRPLLLMISPKLFECLKGIKRKLK